MIAMLRITIQAAEEQNQPDAKRPRANSAGDSTNASVNFIHHNGMEHYLLQIHG